MFMACLLRYEVALAVDLLYDHSFIGYEFMGFVDWFDERHVIIKVAVFMSVLEYMYGVC